MLSFSGPRFLVWLLALTGSLAVLDAALMQDITGVTLSGPSQIEFGSSAEFHLEVTGDFFDVFIRVLENDDDEPPGDNSGTDGENPAGNDLLIAGLSPTGVESFELQCVPGEGLCGPIGCSGERKDNVVFLRVILGDEFFENLPQSQEDAVFSNELIIKCVPPGEIEEVFLYGPSEIKFGELGKFYFAVLGDFDEVLVKVFENDDDEHGKKLTGSDEGNDLLIAGKSAGLDHFYLECVPMKGLCGPFGCSGEKKGNDLFILAKLPGAKPEFSNEVMVKCVGPKKPMQKITGVSLTGPTQIEFGETGIFDLVVMGEFKDVFIRVFENDDDEPPGDNSGTDGANFKGNDLLQAGLSPSGVETFALECVPGKGLCGPTGCSGERKENVVFLRVILGDTFFSILPPSETDPVFSNEVIVQCVPPGMVKEVFFHGPSMIKFGDVGKFYFDITGDFDSVIARVFENDDDEGPKQITGTDKGNDLLIAGETGGAEHFYLECVKGFGLCGPSGCSGEKVENLVFVKAMVLGGPPVFSTEVEVECYDEKKPKRKPHVTGDPHFTTWGGKKYDYQGACDLVLLQNPLFANGLGMDINIRTKLQGTEGSYIESAIVKIGGDVLEVKADHSTKFRQLWLNGEYKPTGSLKGRTLAGYPIRYDKEKQMHATKKRHVYIVQLSKTEKIIIKSFKHLLNVHFANSTKESFQGSLGLLGSFDTGAMVGRDGITEFINENKFGEEWQIRGNEPMLFHEVDGPQHPQACYYVNRAEQQLQRRKLFFRGNKNKKDDVTISRRLTHAISKDEAIKACSLVNEANRDDCVFDVVSMNDLDMVDLYMEDDVDASGAH